MKREFPMDEQTSEIIAVLKALDEDWAIVDEYPDEDFLVLVNESRMVMEDFFPKKTLVQMIEDQGLIKDSGTKRRPKPETFSYFAPDADDTIKEFTSQIPHVYFYKLTAKGRALLQRG